MNFNQVRKSKPLTACDICRKRKIKCIIIKESNRKNCQGCIKSKKPCTFKAIPYQPSFIYESLTKYSQENVKALSVKMIHNKSTLPSNNIKTSDKTASPKNETKLLESSVKEPFNRDRQALPSFSQLIQSIQPVSDSTSETSIEEILRLLKFQTICWQLPSSSTQYIKVYYNNPYIDHFPINFLNDLLLQPTKPLILPLLLHTISYHYLKTSKVADWHLREAYKHLNTIKNDSYGYQEVVSYFHNVVALISSSPSSF